MPNVLALKQRAVEIKNEVVKAMADCDSGAMGVGEFKTKMDKLGKEDKEVGEGIKAYNAALGIAGQGLGAEGAGSGAGEGGSPMAPAPGQPRSLIEKRAQENWAAYKQMRVCARNNLAHKGSGKGDFSFEINLKHPNEQQILLPEEEELGLKAQGVAGLQGEYTSGTTAPPTGNLAQGVYFPAGTAGPTVVPQFIPGIAEMRFYPNVIATLFPSFPVSSPIATYVKETAYNNNAAATPEGATKPTSSSGVARYTEQVGKITNLERVTDEMIQDAPYFWALVQRRGVQGVGRKEEVELLAGTGMPGINGLLNRSAPGSNLSYPSGFLTPTTVTAISNLVIGGAAGAGALSDTVASVTPGRKFTVSTATVNPSPGVLMAEGMLQAITDIRVTYFFEPDAALVNPTDWMTIRLAKDGMGQYLGGSFFGTNYGNPQNAGNLGIEADLTLWGKRVISTPVEPVGLTLVGCFGDAGRILRLGGLRVDLTNMNGFDFEQNLWTMRIEERAGLLVDRPELFELIQWA